MTDAERELLILIAEMTFCNYSRATAERCSILGEGADVFERLMMPMQERLGQALCALRADAAVSEAGG
jgi:hypothetical protein